MADRNDGPVDDLRHRIPGRRRGIALAGGRSFQERRLAPGQTLPVVLEPEADRTDLVSWAEEQRQCLEDLLLANGGILFRGFRLEGAEDLERFVRALSDDVLDYTYRSTPRSGVRGKVYTSTEYPADQEIPLHNELSYTRRWPLKICFLSIQVAASGGATPIADSRKVLAQIDPTIRQRFIDKGVLYVRNYGGGVDLPWQNVFQAADKAEVEDYCRRHGIEFEWTGDDRLRTRQVCQAVARHPRTGEDLWFNQAHLFHVSGIAPDLREFLLAELGEEGLPRNAYYGDGSSIEEEHLRQIRLVYRRNQVVFPWQQGDVLLLDNMLSAHGRQPYSGDRKVVVAMADAWSGHA